MPVAMRTPVSIVDCGRLDYPSRPPFHPAERFPELGAAGPVDPENTVYGAVRTLLYQLGLDRDRYGTAAWNPLGAFIHPGANVVIKPNLVISEHELGEAGLLASVAHGSVIRPLIDYALIANEGKGSVTICDSPIKEVDFAKITRVNGVAGVCAYFREELGQPVHLLDIRDLQATRNEHGVIVAWKPLQGDPLGYTVVDLGKKGMLAEVAQHHKRFRSTAAIYENEANKVHTDTVNKFSIPNTILQADAFISVAKPKTHRKSGITLALKNIIGTTNEKRWLPHHRAGAPSQGGDEYPDSAPLPRKMNEQLRDRLKSHRWGKWAFRFALPPLLLLYKKTVRSVIKNWYRGQASSDFGEGDWYGNDTIWRTVADLNMAIRYADKQGVMRDTPQRSYFCVLDGIVAGDKEGPLHPTPKPTGLLLAGSDPVAVDTVACHIMGLDPARIKQMSEIDRAPWPLGTAADLRVVANRERWAAPLAPGFAHLGFEVCKGWKGHIELPPAPAPRPSAAAPAETKAEVLVG